MAYSRGIIFPTSMEDFLANPIDICFGSMPLESTAPAACPVIVNTPATSFQQVEFDLLTEIHPPTPSNLVVGLDRVASMLANTIKICESVKRSSTTTPPSPCMPYDLWSSIRVVSNHMKKKILIQSGLTTTTSQALTYGHMQGSPRRLFPRPQEGKAHGPPVPCVEEASPTYSCSCNTRSPDPSFPAVPGLCRISGCPRHHHTQ
jgi:hypothetical protein